MSKYSISNGAIQVGYNLADYKTWNTYRYRRTNPSKLLEIPCMRSKPTNIKKEVLTTRETLRRFNDIKKYLRKKCLIMWIFSLKMIFLLICIQLYDQTFIFCTKIILLLAIRFIFPISHKINGMDETHHIWKS